MSQEMTERMMVVAERLMSAAESLDRVLGKLDAQQEVLNAKVDRIVAAIEERDGSEPPQIEAQASTQLQDKVAELQKANTELRAQTARLARKTLSPLVSSLSSKNGSEAEERLDEPALDKVLQALSVEQRIAVKAEMARAGMIE